jgi:hypothetical protein
MAFKTRITRTKNSTSIRRRKSRRPKKGFSKELETWLGLEKVVKRKRKGSVSYTIYR